MEFLKVFIHDVNCDQIYTQMLNTKHIPISYKLIYHSHILMTHPGARNIK